MIEIIRHEKKVYLNMCDYDINNIKMLLSPYFECQINDNKPDLSSWVISLGVDQKFDDDIIVRQFHGKVGLVKRTYIYSKKHKRISVREPQDKEQKLQLAIRLIREIMRHYQIEENHLFFHGGCIEKNNQGIAFLGHKKSGKTTNIINLLSATGYSYVSNDDISFYVDKKKIVAYGWPRAISIRLDTLPYISRFTQLSKLNFSNLKHPDNKKMYHVNKENTIIMYPFELAEACRISIKKQVELKYIIFPEFSDEVTELVEICDCEKIGFLEEFLEQNIDKYFEPFSEQFTSYSPKKEILSEFKKIKMFKLKQNFKTLDKVIALIEELFYE